MQINVKLKTLEEMIKKGKKIEKGPKIKEEESISPSQGVSTWPTRKDLDDHQGTLSVVTGIMDQVTIVTWT